MPAVVLRTRRVGDYDKIISVLTPGMGTIQATVFGAYRSRSRLSGTTEPFNALRLFLYHEPVKQRYKVTDAELYRCFEQTRTDLDRYYIVSLWAEVLLSSYAGGDDSARIYRLLLAALTQIDSVSAEAVGYVSFQFLWRYIRLAGFIPDTDWCGVCDGALGTGTSFRDAEVGFVCPNCSTPGDLALPDGVFVYLKRSLGVDFEPAVRIRLEKDMIGIARRVILTVVSEMVETPLKTLNTGVMKL